MAEGSRLRSVQRRYRTPLLTKLQMRIYEAAAGRRGCVPLFCSPPYGLPRRRQTGWVEQLPPRTGRGASPPAS